VNNYFRFHFYMSIQNIGKYIIRLDSVDSTNNYTSALFAKENPAEGTVIMADYQEAGRGQRETIWESEHGKNLLASIILYPKLDASDYFLFNQCISLAVQEMTETELGKEVKIKWPNDILVKRKKIAGILIENTIRGNSFLHSIAGIGINANQLKFQNYFLPATSFSLEKKNIYMISDLLNKLCSCLNKWYTALEKEDFDFISSSYSKKMYKKDEPAFYESKGEKFEGIIRGVNEDGKLWIEKDNGELLKFSFKEVKFLFE